ncbi:hypothetical protein RKD49_001531 [Streptomyces glaucescens]
MPSDLTVVPSGGLSVVPSGGLSVVRGDLTPVRLAARTVADDGYAPGRPVATA